jgi:hypothetical protein
MDASRESTPLQRREIVAAFASQVFGRGRHTNGFSLWFGEGGRNG